MRVITGRFKGRRLVSIPDRTIRPATDRVKQAVFDALATRLDLRNAEVLDLFAGTGSLGIEALSRGAHHCTFVDSGEGATQCIHHNLETLGCSNSAQVVQVDALRFIDECRTRFRLIFADPPYSFPHTGTIPQTIFTRDLVDQSGYLLIEHEKNVIFEDSQSFAVGSVKKFGSTYVSFFVHRES